MLNRRLWILLIPLALDALLLFGIPPLYATPLITDSRNRIEALSAEAGPEERAAWDELIASIEAGAERDLRGQLALLNWVPAWFVPESGRADGILIDSLRGLLLAILQINMVALVLSGLFLAPLADGVREEATTAQSWLGGAWRMILGVLCFIGIMLGAAVTLGLPFLLLLVLLVAAGPAIALATVVIAAFALQVLFFAIYLYCGFAVEAMLLDRIGPLRAIGRSFQLVRQHFWAAIGLLAILLVINEGMLVIWQQIGEGLAGRLIAIVGTAYIGAGLAAARMVFYRERARLGVQRAPLQAQR